MKRLPRLGCHEARIMADSGILQHQTIWRCLISGPTTFMFVGVSVFFVALPYGLLTIFNCSEIAARYKDWFTNLVGTSRTLMWMLGLTYKIRDKNFFIERLDREIRSKFKLPKEPPRQ